MKNQNSGLLSKFFNNILVLFAMQICSSSLMIILNFIEQILLHITVHNAAIGL
jgi:hypothetical protein